MKFISNLKNQSSSPKLKLIPLGGVGEVTKNMYVYEYGNDQLIVDCGIGFPDSSSPGVDFLIPDISYLEKSNKKIHGIIITHGHMDHFGSLPYILPRLPKTPLYGSDLAIALAKARLQEFNLNPPAHTVKDQLNLGPFSIKFIHITHSTPNSKHLLISTPGATVYHGADFKMDLDPPDNQPPDFAAISQAGKSGVDLLLSDCLGIEKEGITPSEKDISLTIENLLGQTKGKFILTTMSSSIARIQAVFQAAAKYNRQIALAGYSIEKNIAIAAKQNLIKIPPKTLIKTQQVKHLPAHKVAIIIAGSQGQVGSGLYRLAYGQHHHLKLNPQDHVVISSSVIPGSESSVNDLLDTLFQQNVSVSYYGNTPNLHVTGHGHRQDLILLLRLLNPKNVIPIGGDIRHMHLYQQMVLSLGYSQKQAIILKPGQTIVIDQGAVTSGPQLDNHNVYVDGLGVGDVGSTVLRDRQTMAADGILLAIIPIDFQAGKLRGEIEIISKGFTYIKKSKALINKTKQEIIKSLQRYLKAKLQDKQFLKKKIEQSIEKYLYKETERRPLIIAVILEV